MVERTLSLLSQCLEGEDPPQPIWDGGCMLDSSKSISATVGEIKVIFLLFQIAFQLRLNPPFPTPQTSQQELKALPKERGALAPQNQLCKRPQQREKGAKSTRSTQPFAGCLRLPLLQPSRNAPMGCTWHPAERFRCTHGGGLWTCNRLYIEPPYIRVDV